MEPRTGPGRIQYRVIGMDCAHDAAEIERAAGAVAGVESAAVSVASQTLTARLRDAAARDAVERAVAALGYGLDPLDGPGVAASHLTPAYRRALLVVVLLNVGYGIAEAAGGFLSGSQALKADALDFLGDGLITLLALRALGWRAAWRARAALVQGVFLALLGAGVLATTAYRVLVRHAPEAELMGAFGLVALAVNVAAALVLVPHRAGDANARAVWLFSRNDALGNLAVVLAAAVVAYTGSAWPDLVVAVAIAGLFLHSAWRIVRDAWGELREG